MSVKKSQGGKLGGGSPSLQSAGVKDNINGPAAAAASPLPAAPDVLPSVRPWVRAKRGAAFSIFVDTKIAVSASVNPTPRSDGRRILGVLNDNGNNRQGPSPRCDTTPFQFRASDGNWSDLENYEPSTPETSTSIEFASHLSNTPIFTPGGPRAQVETPPTTPHPVANATSQRARNGNGNDNGNGNGNGNGKVNGNGNTRAHTRIPFRLRPSNDRSPGSPKSMELYHLLGLKDWTANPAEIKAAYKRVAMKSHPDKVREELRDKAHSRMARINGARDVLVNGPARKKYDKDGKVPWAV